MELAEHMARDNKGVLPSPSSLFERGHSKTTSEGQRVLQGKKAIETMDKLKNKMREYEEQGKNVSENEVFYDVVGGRQKGVVYGLGTSAEFYYKKTSSRSSHSTASYTPSVVTQLQDRFERAEERAERAERAEEIYKKLEEMSEFFIQARCGGFPNFSPDPRDPSSGSDGASLAT